MGTVTTLFDTLLGLSSEPCSWEVLNRSITHGCKLGAVLLAGCILVGFHRLLSSLCFTRGASPARDGTPAGLVADGELIVNPRSRSARIVDRSVGDGVQTIRVGFG